MAAGGTCVAPAWRRRRRRAGLRGRERWVPWRLGCCRRHKAAGGRHLLRLRHSPPAVRPPGGIAATFACTALPREGAAGATVAAAARCSRGSCRQRLQQGGFRGALRHAPHGEGGHWRCPRIRRPEHSNACAKGNIRRYAIVTCSRMEAT